jgi:phosphodiesterase/alkaline phosphatase D-like protein
MNLMFLVPEFTFFNPGFLRLSFVVIIALSACTEQFNQEEGFESNFNSSQPRTWIGPEYWSNPIQDWRIKNGELQCLVSKRNRNVHLLTQKLDTIWGDLNMQVQLRVSALPGGSHNDWLGFEIGARGKFNDHRDDAVFGNGLKAGVTTNGNLFIGEISANEVNNEIRDMLLQGVVLQVILTPGDSGYQLTLSLFDNIGAEPIVQLSTENIAPDRMTGDLVLVSNYDIEAGDPAGNSKSVAFKNWSVSGSKIKTCEPCEFGPIMFSQYTLSRGSLKLTAQMAPVDTHHAEVRLQLQEKGVWKTIQTTGIDEDARTATFSLPGWQTEADTPYRIAFWLDRGNDVKEEFYWSGTIRKDPVDQEEIVIAGFTGNDHLGFPHTDIYNQVKFHDPDVLFFSGDQIYEPNGGYGVQRTPFEKATLDYLRKWYLYGWAFRDLMKDRPTISITDDHDVYHGNIWGAGGRATPADYGQGTKAQDAGGYKMPAQWVKMVERSQTSHLPDPFDPTPVGQGIGTYYTDMVYGGISFAIIEDRKFKSAPKALLPEAKIVNGWPQNKGFNMVENGDAPGAKLLGDRQLLFLDQWATDWSYQAEMKILLSQTIFANVATLPEEALSGAIIPTLRIMHKGDYPPDDKPVTDLDSNGWPQSGRNKAVASIRKGFAFHLAGDQHLGSTIQYGLDEWNDSGFAFCVPSISNHWPRRWYPAAGGANRDPEKPKYTGENLDGFGNKITVYAASNPLFTGQEPARLYDRAAGYGIVRFNKTKRNIVIECWPRQANPTLGDKEQFNGWPIEISQKDNYGRMAYDFLPEIKIDGLENPVLIIINEATGETIYAIRLQGKTFKAKVFDPAIRYIVKVGEPDTGNWQVKKGVKPGDPTLDYRF